MEKPETTNEPIEDKKDISEPIEQESEPEEQPVKPKRKRETPPPPKKKEYNERHRLKKVVDNVVERITKKMSEDKVFPQVEIKSDPPVEKTVEKPTEEVPEKDPYCTREKYKKLKGIVKNVQSDIDNLRQNNNNTPKKYNEYIYNKLFGN